MISVSLRKLLTIAQVATNKHIKPSANALGFLFFDTSREKFICNAIFHFVNCFLQDNMV